MEKTTAWMLGDQLPSVYFYYVCWDIWNIPSLLREGNEYFECEKRRFPDERCTGQGPGWPGEQKTHVTITTVTSRTLECNTHTQETYRYPLNHLDLLSLIQKIFIVLP